MVTWYVNLGDDDLIIQDLCTHFSPKLGGLWRPHWNLSCPSKTRWTQHFRCDLSLPWNNVTELATGLCLALQPNKTTSLFPQSCSSICSSLSVILQEIIPSWVQSLHLSLSKKCMTIIWEATMAIYSGVGGVWISQPSFYQFWNQHAI